MTEACTAARAARKQLTANERRRWSVPGPNGCMWYQHPRLSKTWDGHKPCGYVIPYSNAPVFAASYHFTEVTNGIATTDHQTTDHPTLIDAMRYVMARADQLADTTRRAGLLLQDSHCAA